MGKRIGIDLGTTYCCVCYVDETGTVRIIEPSEGNASTTPSVVFFDPNGEAVVGATARSEGALNPECMVERVKNYMGDPSYTLCINGQEYSPAAISSLILKKLCTDAEASIGEIEGAVITCPAYFGDAAREATRKAGENVVLSDGSHLKVLQILDEPVAASLAYGNEMHEDMRKKVLVYDLGGGTFDCTVMNICFEGDNRTMEVVTTDGNHQLGGKDWDDSLGDYVRRKFCDLTGEDFDEMKYDPESRAWFSENIEKAKIALTMKQSTTLIPSFNGKKEKIEITREAFEAETEGWLNQTIQLVNGMLYNKGISMDDYIDEILLTGGSTRMPQVAARLKAEYNKPLVAFEQDKAVAMGAALVANGIKLTQATAAEDVSTESTVSDGKIVIEGQGESTEIIIKCTKSYGLIAYDNDKEIVANIIMKDTIKPAVKARRFGTSEENQANINLRVFENNSISEDATVEESTELYESCIVELLPGLPKNAPIEITFEIDINGILVITAYDVTNNVSTRVTPKRIGGDADDIGMDEIRQITLR